MQPRRSFLPLACLLLGLGCFGTNRSSDRAGTANGKLTVLPEAPTVVAGHTLQFSASTPWGNDVIWSVVPASEGSISTTGLFTASGPPGTATVFAVWAKDVRYVASTRVTILAPAPPAVISPHLVQAFGAAQTVPGTAISNAVVGGETVPAKTAASANEAIQVRHGFDPPVK
ncbi:hypothetical protein GETHLI_29210 [Geothrix limicola]|uniref:BIG2 domain-containing protein n=1 Tax=Geothrix limicola TaxID=2927978 RepID=A0ABQ5QIK9_9BACT|nr:hypothetical protein [Geothrix limicola]GLH74419.1 hypothetical protein GETHLI_29210 [Geothrix limicola]